MCSERWATCPRCKGLGGFESYEKDLILLREEKTVVVCPRCDGTGFDGSIDAYEVDEHELYGGIGAC